ncbi:hypothetical protein H1R20_g14967, partial [Candolleomyces eurysporus]
MVPFADPSFKTRSPEVYEEIDEKLEKLENRYAALKEEVGTNLGFKPSDPDGRRPPAP